MKRKSLFFLLLIIFCLPWAANAQCTPYDIPYTYGFEEEDQFACWTVIAGGVTRDNGYIQHTGSYHLDFRSSNYSMIALPQFNEATSNLRVQFYTCPEYENFSGYFAVGYMTDITDASTFVAVETFNSSAMTPEKYVKKTVDMFNVPANANIAMRQSGALTAAFHWYVDDVTVKEIPSCLEPTGLAANITATSAELSWTARNDETDWTVYYKKTRDENYTEIADATNPYTLNGLNIDTEYQYYVVANCSGDDASEPSEEFTFYIPCSALSTFPITYGFETSEGFPENAYVTNTNQLGQCWRNEVTFAWGIWEDRLWSTSTAEKHHGSQALVLPDKGHQQNPAKTMLVFPEMNFTNADGYTVSFWIYRSAGWNYPEGFRVYVSDCDTIGPNAVDLGFYSRHINQPYPETVPTIDWYHYETEPIMMQGSVYLIFEGLSYMSTDIYVDDIVIKEVVLVSANQIVNTVTDPSTQMTWNQFAQHVNNGDVFLNDIYLMEDVNIINPTMVGTEDNPFKGTFNGNGHTLSVYIISDEKAAAPFHYISGATIKNLKVTGTLWGTNTTSEGYHVGGLVGYAMDGTNTIENCLVSTNITIDTFGGGIVGHAKSSTLNLTGCIYDGNITNHVPTTDPNCGVGGLVGWCDSPTLNITDCIYNGSNGVIYPYGVFFHPVACKSGSGTVTATVSDCYYFCDEPADDTDGSNNIAITDARKAYKVTGTGGVSVDIANEQPISYSCSGIYGYEGAWTGIKAYDNIYGGDGKTLDLTLSGAPGYVADHGTLEANGGSYALTMEAYDTEISGISNGFTKVINGYSEGQGINNGWYLIASPLEKAFVPSIENGFLNNNYDLYAFDQNPADGMEWRNYEANAFDLEAGQGYLYANSEDVTLIFPGTPYNGSGEVTLSKTDGAEFSGWNLVGNPFTETAFIDREFYIMNDDGSEIIAAEENSIAPMEGVFVIANEDGETMTFTTTRPSSKGRGLALNLSQGYGVIDRAIVRFGEGRQLPKFQINRNSTKVYIPQDGKDYAIVNAAQEGELPVNFKAEKNGTYTLTVNVEGLDLAYLHLIDNMTGADVDLLATSSYTFTAKTTDYASRFKLVFSTNGEDGPSTGSGTFAFISDGNIIVNGEGVLQVVDVMGHVVIQGDAMNRVSTSEMTPGVYVLRLIDGNDVRMQKMVIE